MACHRCRWAGKADGDALSDKASLERPSPAEISSTKNGEDAPSSGAMRAPGTLLDEQTELPRRRERARRRASARAAVIRSSASADRPLRCGRRELFALQVPRVGCALSTHSPLLHERQLCACGLAHNVGSRRERSMLGCDGRQDPRPQARDGLTANAGQARRVRGDGKSAHSRRSSTTLYLDGDRPCSFISPSERSLHQNMPRQSACIFHGT